jgi:tripartite-type tricarboxylate transporter receptor subunit TctC
VTASFLFAVPAAAQDAATFYKGKTVRLVVGFTPGGGYDVYARALGRHFGRHIPGNPTVVVQNMPGAASLKSVQYLNAGAPADGTVITTFNPGLITQSLTAPDKVPVKFLDYAWIGNVSEDFRVCFTWNATGRAGRISWPRTDWCLAIPGLAPPPISTTACSATCSAPSSTR